MNTGEGDMIMHRFDLALATVALSAAVTSIHADDFNQADIHQDGANHSPLIANKGAPRLSDWKSFSIALFFSLVQR